MKRIITTLVLVVSAIALYAQKDVTKFLGIPVDGTKAAMKAKLIEKGFEYDAKNDIFTGEFNGADVLVSVVTNNNKVYRIALTDKNSCDESAIKIRFNRLVSQFERNQKYIPHKQDASLSDSENIRYEMLVNNKRYEAIFYQKVSEESVDTVAARKKAYEFLSMKYTKEQLDNPTDELRELIDVTTQSEKVMMLLELINNKPVWFMINRDVSRYYITMYYDNEYNHSDGEDL